MSLRAAALGIWAASCVVVGAFLLASHLLTLPVPARDDVRQAVARTRTLADHDRWLVVHVLAADCGCSRRVLEHLLATGRPAAIAERIVWIASADRAVPAAPGFQVERVSPASLADRYAVDAAPLLIVVDPRGEVRYVGGYTLRKQAAEVRDLEVIAALRAGEQVVPLPAFGCAVSQQLEVQLDPLRIRGWL